MTFSPQPSGSGWEDLRRHSPGHVLELADVVWGQKELFVRWPNRALSLMDGCARQPYHDVPTDIRSAVKAAAIRLDTRSNGPAVMAYLLAGGERPSRALSTHQWSIHHVYDGKFPAPGRESTLRAVADGRYFTATAGLVAVHPIADAMAAEVPYFAWLLRKESHDRLGLDPDGVFDGAG